LATSFSIQGECDILRSPGEISILDAGHRLRALREELGLTIRDVETSSARIAAKHRNNGFLIPLSRLSEIETKGVLPSIYRLYSLSVIYRRDIVTCSNGSVSTSTKLPTTSDYRNLPTRILPTRWITSRP
jgi:hypothetical protein